MPFDVRRDALGWTVYHTSTGLPAIAAGALLVGIDIEDADDLVDFLNLSIGPASPAEIN
jgi:hypothetical protein